MYNYEQFTDSILKGWEGHQEVLVTALQPLTPGQLALRLKPELRSVGETAAHIIGARARWFYQLMGEGGKQFKALSTWDRRAAKIRTPEELASGLRSTWDGMVSAISRWTAEEWEMTWPGEYAGEPTQITRQWVIWHLIEHDLHHGGEISITLGANGLPGVGV